MTDNEINAALAEKAEGWKPNKHGGWNRPYGWAAFPPDYASNPSASHALKEAMRAKGWLYESEDYRLSEGGLSHISRWRRPDEHPSMFAANDPSELRAVALAACRALGIGV